jgi:hypothetical protein
MSDDRFTREPGDDTEDDCNENGERPYLDVPPPGVRPARNQPAGDELVSADEIQEFIRQQYPETVKRKRALVRPAGWDEIIADVDTSPRVKGNES